MNHQSTTQAASGERNATSEGSSSAWPSSMVEEAGVECAEQREDFQKLLDEVGDAVVHYCRRRPGVAAMTVFAAGVFFGWKIKPW